jgi:predicted nucleotidyltransferase
MKIVTRDEVIAALRADRAALDRFRVASLAVFGSVVRGEMHAGSDIDILVEFEAGAQVGLFDFVRLRRHLAEILGAPVDLVTPAALRAELRDAILREAVRAA